MLFCIINAKNNLYYFYDTCVGYRGDFRSYSGIIGSYSDYSDTCISLKDNFGGFRIHCNN